MKYKWLLIGFFLFTGLISCKKDNNPASGGITIVGKWFVTKQASALYDDSGAQIATFTKTNFTNVDFVEFYSDGSGYMSKTNQAGPSLTEFSYTISGTKLVQYTSSEPTGTPETITNLTAENMSIHVVLRISDPNDPSVTDTEIDDFTYVK
jgi:hypothetical protein